jgi:8-oxo-dGTP pyrophosphatase MutT (NUDIX family)
MAEGRIRAVALAIFIRPRDGAVLAVRFGEPDRVFYRPPGGGIEFGEQSREAACREAVEELGYPVRAERLLGVVENLFVYEGRTRHEIIFHWLLHFEDPTLYDRHEFKVEEMDGNRYVAHWVQDGDLAARGIRLVPRELLPLLEKVA